MIFKKIKIILLLLLISIFGFFIQDKTSASVFTFSRTASNMEGTPEQKAELKKQLLAQIDFLKKEIVRLQTILDARTQKVNGSKNDLQIVDKIISWGHYTPSNPRFIDTIIIHSSYNALGNDIYSVKGVLYEFKLYNVSSHYLITRDGVIYRLVVDRNIAYHAGRSKMPDGRTNINDFSIGIELLYYKNETPNEIQYQKLANLVKNLKLKYKINYILGHKDIRPFHKTDPWNFDWQKFNQLLK